ncbi:MAG: hypothetical protein CM15mP120_15640 [Pseudomonadota bacterium]|nr:MAG: hypothetical protein CM15mP120_15640 [Pseudomonadota bacterium]
MKRNAVSYAATQPIHVNIADIVVRAPNPLMWSTDFGGNRMRDQYE